ncbi:10420_t:CDS:2, partial [Scutellospora calospora]
QTTPIPNNERNVSNQETLQALLALLNNTNQTTPQNNQASYLGIQEEDESLFLLADRIARQKPISGTLILLKKKNQENSVGLGGTDEILIPDINTEMREGDEEHQDNQDNSNWIESNGKDNPNQKDQPEQNKKNTSDEKDNLKIEEKIRKIKNNKRLDVSMWPISCLNTKQGKEYEPVADLFDYYYEDDIQVRIDYQVGDLEKDQKDQLSQLLDKNKDISAQSLSELGRANKVRHQIPTRE